MKVTPESYLLSQSIDLKKTTLISCIDDHMRQPDLISLLEGYHKAKLAELDMKLEQGAMLMEIPVDGYPSE